MQEPPAADAQTCAAALLALFGPQLLMPGGGAPVETRVALSGKSVVGVFFSGHWCPPSREFTPRFARAYTQMFEAKGMAVVFVSADRDEHAFRDYHSHQPWHALPYADRGRERALSQRFGVRGIPSLILLRPDGSLITAEGRSLVLSSPESCPWTSRPANETTPAQQGNCDATKPTPVMLAHALASVNKLKRDGKVQEAKQAYTRIISELESECGEVRSGATPHYFVPGPQHVILIESRQARIS